jgi:hypothetical protein
MNDAPRMPPRYLPVLTETVDAVSAPAPLEPSAVPSSAPVPGGLDALEDHLVHRLMQRVDVALEQQLHDAVASMVLQHTHALVPRLREEVEFVVRQAVAQAVAAELAGRAPA